MKLTPKIWKLGLSADIAKKTTPSVWSRLQRLVRYLKVGCPDTNMFYENGKPKREISSAGSIDLSEVEKLIKSSNAELLTSILQQMKKPLHPGSKVGIDEDYSKETMSKLAKMMGEKRVDDGVQDIGRKIEINSDIEKDKNTIDLLKSLGD